MDSYVAGDDCCGREDDGGGDDGDGDDGDGDGDAAAADDDDDDDDNDDDCSVGCVTCGDSNVHHAAVSSAMRSNNSTFFQFTQFKVVCTITAPSDTSSPHFSFAAACVDVTH